MDLQKVKQFYIETWWLWTLYLVGCILAVWFIHPIFLTALPAVAAISIYFAIIRGPSQSSDSGEADEPDTRN